MELLHFANFFLSDDFPSSPFKHGRIPVLCSYANSDFVLKKDRHQLSFISFNHNKSGLTLTVNEYSQTCVQRPPMGPKNSGLC